jgi:hypothetical protein
VKIACLPGCWVRGVRLVSFAGAMALGAALGAALGGCDSNGHMVHPGGMEGMTGGNTNADAGSAGSGGAATGDINEGRSSTGYTTRDDRSGYDGRR